MKKKVLIFSLVYLPIKVGGAETAIKEITDRLSEDKYEFHLLCNGYDSTFPKTEKIGNVIVHRIGLTKYKPKIADLRKPPLHLNKVIFQFYAFWEAKKLHKEYSFDGIWAMMAHSCGIPAAKFKKTFPEVKYLLTLQEGDPPKYIEAKMKVFGKSFDRAFSSADTIQVISTFLGRWAKQKGFAGEPLLIPNAVNIAHFTQTYSDTELSEVRREIGVSDEDCLLVTTSRLVHKNAIDDAIRSIALLPNNFKFVVFGIGPDEDKLRSLAAELNIEDRILFRGQIDHEVMPKYLKACDIFIRASRSEGMGNSFVEAMVAELPVIATQEGGIADFLFDENKNPGKETTGWAVDTNSPEQIKKAVEDIMTRPEKVTEVLREAKSMAISKYDWDLIAKRMDEEVFQPLFGEV
jgi:glycosyltransferase involved in cell wall biosynthesis